MPRRASFDIDAFLAEVQRDRGYEGQIVHRRSLPARSARYAPLEPPLPSALRERLRALGIARLYTHQAAAVDAVRRGEHIAVVTPTASGKTLCYNLPVLEHLVEHPQDRAIYLFPTKALAQDQRDALEEFDWVRRHSPGTREARSAQEEIRAISLQMQGTGDGGTCGELS